jgi:hypothetical protein
VIQYASPGGSAAFTAAEGGNQNARRASCLFFLLTFAF